MIEIVYKFNGEEFKEDDLIQVIRQDMFTGEKSEITGRMIKSLFNTELVLDINLEKLYFNMLDAKADYLYNLPQWDGIFSIEKRKEIQKAYKATNMVINDNKVGRNDACPCGSGKKYKKCCGK